MTLALFGRAVVIALVAAIFAWLPLGILWALGMDQSVGLPAAFSLLPISLMGSFGVGLPVALLSFFLARDHIVNRPATLFLMANLAAAMMALASIALAGSAGAMLLGVPSFLAANTYAVLGWLWIIRPLRNSLNSPPQDKELA